MFRPPNSNNILFSLLFFFITTMGVEISSVAMAASGNPKAGQQIYEESASTVMVTQETAKGKWQSI